MTLDEKLNTAYRAWLSDKKNPLLATQFANQCHRHFFDGKTNLVSNSIDEDFLKWIGDPELINKALKNLDKNNVTCETLGISPSAIPLGEAFTSIFFSKLYDKLNNVFSLKELTFDADYLTLVNNTHKKLSICNLFFYYNEKKVFLLSLLVCQAKKDDKWEDRFVEAQEVYIDSKLLEEFGVSADLYKKFQDSMLSEDLLKFKSGDYNFEGEYEEYIVAIAQNIVEEIDPQLLLKTFLHVHQQ